MDSNSGGGDENHPTSTGPGRESPPRYRGHVRYLFAFDLAYDMSRKPVDKLLGQPVAQFSVDASRRGPRQLFSFRPQMVRLPPVERIGPLGRVGVERTIKLLPTGAITISVSVPFEVDSLGDLVVFHDLEFSSGSLQDEVRALAEEVRHELTAYYIRPVAKVLDEEAYTVFCVDGPIPEADGTGKSAEEWLADHRDEVACLLTQERVPGSLSHQETSESTSRHLSYYRDDLVVIDWDAALVIEHPSSVDESVYIMELANLQLAELEAYDRILDVALERSYRDLSSGSQRSRGAVLKELREIRIDMARFSDELSNITKFFGDWHLARIYEHISARFHLSDWHKTVDEKLGTLDNLYQLLIHDQNNRWMLILEVTVVLLFIIDLFLIMKGH